MSRKLNPHTRVAHLRRGRGWSQSELAEKAGVSRAGISAIEMGRLVPSVAAALRVASALGESVESVFGDAPLPVLRWAWAPAGTSDGRAWQATVGRQVLTFGTEPTAAGTIPHDGWTDGRRWVQRSNASLPDRTLVVAGCDPLVGLLAREMATTHQIRVLPLLRSSTAALALLRQGLVHVAGIHYSDSASRSANDRVVRGTLGPGYRLMHQLRWDTGIALTGHRPERSAAALLRANVRWVNREEGSSARRTFDVLLGSRRRPSGYECVVRDHRAVAATVSSGWAEAGVCIRPTATEARLGFIPVQQEAYELCVSESLSDDPRVRALLATLQSPGYRQLLDDVPGCKAARTGDVRPVA
ncbi:MAG: substrate-binding domain-containing protein [Vicinamibacterales bacterium]